MTWEKEERKGDGVCCCMLVCWCGDRWTAKSKCSERATAHFYRSSPVTRLTSETSDLPTTNMTNGISYTPSIFVLVACTLPACFLTDCLDPTLFPPCPRHAITFSFSPLPLLSPNRLRYTGLSLITVVSSLSGAPTPTGDGKSNMGVLRIPDASRAHTKFLCRKTKQPKKTVRKWGMMGAMVGECCGMFEKYTEV